MRIFHRLYAKALGYFWLPCPICGKYFGGHESFFGVPLIDDDGHAYVTCSVGCSRESKRLNVSRGREWPSRMSVFELHPVETTNRSDSEDTGARA